MHVLAMSGIRNSTQLARARYTHAVSFWGPKTPTQTHGEEHNVMGMALWASFKLYLVGNIEKLEDIILYIYLIEVMKNCFIWLRRKISE